MRSSDDEHTEEVHGKAGCFCGAPAAYSSLRWGAGSPAGKTEVRGRELSMASVGNRAELRIGLSDLVSHLKQAGQE